MCWQHHAAGLRTARSAPTTRLESADPRVGPGARGLGLGGFGIEKLLRQAGPPSAAMLLELRPRHCLPKDCRAVRSWEALRIASAPAPWPLLFSLVGKRSGQLQLRWPGLRLQALRARSPWRADEKEPPGLVKRPVMLLLVEVPETARSTRDCMSRHALGYNMGASPLTRSVSSSPGININWLPAFWACVAVQLTSFSCRFSMGQL